MFFSPHPKHTLIKAITNDQLLGAPAFTTKALNKCLLTSTATIKGHLHCNHKNLHSTTKMKPIKTKNYTQDMYLPEDRNTNCELVCHVALAEEFNNIIYSDATGKFPVP